MSPIQNLRESLAYVLICSLFVTGLLTITPRQSRASNNSLMRSSTPGVNEPSEETGPQTKTVDEATRARVSEAYNKLPLSFEENRGQVDKEVKYLSRGRGYTLFLTPTEAVLTLQRSDGKKATTTAADDRRSTITAQPHPTRMSVVRMKLSGANQSPAVTGEREMGVKINYFKGNDPEKWHTDVARYERVRYAQVYPGVDMIYYGKQQQLEYDFEVAPGADTRRIALEFRGAKRVKIERETGDLLLKTEGVEVRQHKPVTYQEAGGERREVASRYVMKGRRKVGIEVGEYDRTKRLVIDPVLSYSTYLGGSNTDLCDSIAVDSAGHAYVMGTTFSSDFPTLHQYQTYQGYQGYADIFVTKLDTNASGTASLLYSTYLGGSGAEEGQGIAIDASSYAYVTGTTFSSDFPTKNQYQTDQTDNDAFVTKLDTNLSGAASLLYSTYLGGSDLDYSGGIAVDEAGHAYLAGTTFSSDFPTLNQYQTDQSDVDAFVTELDTNASGIASLLYSTYLGGSYYDEGIDIAVDASGIAYVTGYTASSDFPTLNQYQIGQGGDVFVTKLDMNASGTAALLYSTYLAGSSIDAGWGIAIDSSGIAYVTGYTESNDFPTLNQYQADQGGMDAFVTKLDTNASGAASLLYSTYLAGSDLDAGIGIAVDASGHVYVTGHTLSTNFPMLNQYQTDQPDRDAFVTKLDTNLSGAASLLYSTYLGGNGSDYGRGIAVDSSGNTYVTGEIFSSDFPTKNQYQTDQGGGDGFVTRLTDTVSYSTYLGGSDNDFGHGIAVDAAGHAYVTGTTVSIDFPTLNQYQTDQGDADVFVMKLDTNASGTASLLYSTYLGGDGIEDGQSIAIDTSGHAYVTGWTYSSDFPTLNQYQTDQGYADVFVTKLDTNASGTASLLYSTYLGGSDLDESFGIAVDAAGHAYVTGEIFSTNFPTLNQYQTVQSGINAFVTKLDTNASGTASLLYSTYLGGSDNDYGSDIAVDAAGHAYVTGTTVSIDFPTLNQYQTDQGDADVFVMKLDTNASGTASLLYSTYLGGSDYDFGYGIAVDASGNVYVTGYTLSTNFPTLNQYQTDQGGIDVFVTKLDTNLSGTAAFLYSTYLGGSDLDYGDDIAVDASGNVYVVGFTYSSDFPTKNQYQTDQAGTDAFVIKFTNTVIISGRVTSDGSTPIGGVTVTLTNAVLSLTTTTASDGTYSFNNLPTPANYKIKPSKTHYTFSPTSIVLSSVTENQPDTDFIGTLKTYTIGGIVKLGTAGLSDVTVTLTSPNPAGFDPRTVTTDSTGAYSLTNVPAGRDYTVTPTKIGYQFTPANRVLTNLSANHPAVGFAVKVYLITGRITRTNSTAIVGVTVTLTSPTPAGYPARTAQTYASGNYFFYNCPAGRDYTIEPAKTGFTFTPTTQSITNLNSDIPAGASTNFTGTGP